MKESSVGRVFSKYVFFNVLGMIALSCYFLADTFFIANGVGDLGLAALTLTLPAFSVVNGVGLMLGMGGGTRYSIFVAEGKRDKANAAYTQTVITAGVSSLVFMAIGAGATSQISSLLGADAETLSYAVEYLRTLMLFSPLFIYNNVFLGFLRNDGAPRLAMAGMVVGSLTNVVLDYVFVMPLGMGMFGAALATCIAPIISLCFQSAHFWRKKNSFHFVKVKLSPREAGKISALGISAFLTEFSWGVVMLVFNSILLGLVGNVAVSAFGVVANIYLVVIAIFTGVSQGSQPVESTYYGRGDRKNLRKTLVYAMITAFAFGAVAFTVCAVWAEEIAALFNSAGVPDFNEIAAQGMRLYYIGFLFAGVSMIIANYLSATDTPKPSFAITATRGLVAIIPLAFLLSHFAGLTGVWLSFPAAELIGLIVAVVMLLYTYKKRTLAPLDVLLTYRRARQPQ